METAGNKTRLLVFVDISVIKLDKALYYFGKVDPCQVVLSYNIWSLSMTSKSQPPQMEKYHQQSSIPCFRLNLLI